MSLRVLFALAALCSSIDACTRQSDPPAQTPPLNASGPGVPQDTALVRADKARIQGSDNAKVWLVIASDFQCPFCRAFHDETYKKILEDYVVPGKVRVAFLNHPMSAHRFAIPAAEAAMCAAMQDRFWPMHDQLFIAQAQWSKLADPRPAFDSLAASLKLRMDDWRTCVSSHGTRAVVDADLMRSKLGGVEGTPSFFIGDKLAIVGAKPYSEFRAALDAAIAEAGGPPAGSGRQP